MKPTVSLGHFAKAGDISVVHNEYHGTYIPDELIEQIVDLLEKQRRFDQRPKVLGDEGGSLQDLFEQAVDDRDTAMVSRLLDSIEDLPTLGFKGCEAAILLGDQYLMAACMSKLDVPAATFWNARIDLLSGRQASSIQVAFENLEEMSGAGLGLAAFRGISNGLSDLGFWDASMGICLSLLDTKLVKADQNLKAKVLTDLLRSRCRASQEVGQIADSVEEIVLREVNQWQEQIYSLELKKWSLVWKIEGRRGADSMNIRDELARLKKINTKSGNRFSPIILNVLEGLGLVCGQLPDMAQEKFSDVLEAASSQPYCNYLAYEAANFARKYIGPECPVVLGGMELLDAQSSQRLEIEAMLSDKSVLRRIQEQIKVLS